MLIYNVCLYFCSVVQSSRKSSVLESIVGKDFLPRGSDMKRTRRGTTETSSSRPNR
ncbi:unnamed protein product, partial [Prunus brigantina]